MRAFRDLKSVTHAAARAPVATQHRKARFVLTAIEDFERLRAAIPDPRLDRVVGDDNTDDE